MILCHRVDHPDFFMQRPKSEGLGAAFGCGVTDNIFGDGNTINDASFSDHAFCIRRERTPQLGERLYLITVQARDASGNTTTKVLPIRVAANNSGGGSCPSIGTVITDNAPCE